MRQIILIISALLLLSCATERPQGKTEAEILYKEARNLMDDGRYLLAIEKLNTIRSKHPYSYYATHAELLNADVLYAQENYAEAAAAYIVFKDFHPKNKRMPYVIWRIGESFFNQLPDTFDRDLSTGLEAIKYYRELITLYPSDEKVGQAKERISFCKEQLVKKEKYIADFYYKTEVYDSAKFRYLGIIKNYETDEKLMDHSMVRLVYSSAYLNDKKGCSQFYSIFKGRVNENTKRKLDDAYRVCQSIKEEGKEE